MIPIDAHQFYIFTTETQRSITKHAESMAGSKATNLSDRSDAKISQIARKICRECYKKFQESLREKFPSEAYADLIDLTIKSRSFFFSKELVDRLRPVIGGQPVSEPADNLVNN